MPDVKKQVGKVNPAVAAKAKEAIEAITAVEAEDSGVPEGELTVEEKISGQLVKILNEPRTNLTGPNMLDDWLYLPEVITLTNGSTRKITKHVRILGNIRYLTPDAEYLLRWCHPGRFNRHQRQGFRFIKYDDMLKDSDAFKKSTEGFIQNGDLYLMKISIAGFGRMLKQKVELQATMEGSFVGPVAKEAEKFNTKAFIDHPDGTKEFIN